MILRQRLKSLKGPDEIFYRFRYNCRRHSIVYTS